VSVRLSNSCSAALATSKWFVILNNYKGGGKLPQLLTLAVLIKTVCTCLKHPSHIPPLDLIRLHFGAPVTVSPLKAPILPFQIAAPSLYAPPEPNIHPNKTQASVESECTFESPFSVNKLFEVLPQAALAVKLFEAKHGEKGHKEKDLRE
jgi:hypothetical protein